MQAQIFMVSAPCLSPQTQLRVGNVRDYFHGVGRAKYPALEMRTQPPTAGRQQPHGGQQHPVVW